MANILITSEFFCKFDNKARQMLIDAGHNIIDNPYGHKKLTSEEIIPYVSNVDALICDLEKINKEVIDKANALKIIARRGVGVDSIDLVECNKKNIEITRCVGLVENSVAELVMSYIFEFSRKISILSKDMNNGVWNKIIGNNLFGKTLGLIGFGNIAKEVAKRANAFDMKVIFYDKYVTNGSEYKAEYKSFEDVLKSSDFISVHVPLVDSTRNIINANTISLMKKNAYLINTARGGIVNEGDVARALIEEKIQGVAIDVFEKEPDTDCALKGLKNAILTPHVATFTIETFIAMDRRCAENIIEFFKRS